MVVSHKKTQIILQASEFSMSIKKIGSLVTHLLHSKDWSDLQRHYHVCYDSAEKNGYFI